MSIGTVGGTGQNYPFLSVQQALSATSADAFTSVPGDSSAGANATNSLTGGTSASLSTQTLQALMDMTQSDDPAASTSPSSGTASGAHHHHHHHGAPPAGSSTASTASTTSTDPTASIAELDSGEDTDNSLESALTQLV